MQQKVHSGQENGCSVRVVSLQPPDTDMATAVKGALRGRYFSSRLHTSVPFPPFPSNQVLLTWLSLPTRSSILASLTSTCSPASSHATVPDLFPSKSSFSLCWSSVAGRLVHPIRLPALSTKKYTCHQPRRFTIFSTLLPPFIASRSSPSIDFSRCPSSFENVTATASTTIAHRHTAAKVGQKAIPL